MTMFVKEIVWKTDMGANLRIRKTRALKGGSFYYITFKKYYYVKDLKKWRIWEGKRADGTDARPVQDLVEPCLFKTMKEVRDACLQIEMEHLDRGYIDKSRRDDRAWRDFENRAV